MADKRSGAPKANRPGLAKLSKKIHPRVTGV